MTGERRYDDDEVAEIFEVVTAERVRRGKAPSSDRGLTLGELQDIGREVGLAPEKVADAAIALDSRRDRPPRRTWLGIPISVGRTVDLPRAPTDREWEVLVAALRETFGARGRVGSHGSLREWNNGNLHACVEPTETGYRLRLGTLKGSAVQMGSMGTALLGIASVLVVVISLTGGNFRAPMILGALGAALLAATAVGLPGWARERERQMEHIAARARGLVEGDPGRETE